MILQSLNQLYQRLLAEPDSGVSPPGYSKARVSFALNLSPAGVLLDVIDLRTEGKKPLPRDLDVPRQAKRSSGVHPNFLCDNAGYVLGLGQEGHTPRTLETHEAFVELHQSVLGELDDAGANALCAFLAAWNPLHELLPEVLLPLREEVTAGGNIVFRLSGQAGFIHERAALRAAWDRYDSGNASTQLGQCLVTGEVGPIARLHDSIKGVAGAQSTGAALVSFNLAAFSSYGKEQSFNAPVSEAAAFGYVTALNYLLRSSRHRMRVGDATTVFWAERSAEHAEDFLAELLDPSDPLRVGAKKTASDDAAGTDGVPAAPRRDLQTTQLVHDVLQRLSRGEAVPARLVTVDPGTRFFVLGLSPNSARLSVRFWQDSTFGALFERVSQHYRDMAVVMPDWERSPSLRQILIETAPLGDIARASSLLAGALARAVMQGSEYPQSLLTAMLSRVRADHKVSGIRAGAIKACLLRRARRQGYADKEGMITVSLNDQCADASYLLGRLFALLEKAQQDANPGINATIRDRYFGAASATPRSVFPILLRLSQHHLAKAEYGGVTDKRIEAILARVSEFPPHLDLEGQGMFILGYYHQRQSFYQKKQAETASA